MSKIEQLVQTLKKQQADAMWVSNPINIFYLTGYKSEPHERLFALLVRADGQQILFCPQLEVEEAKASPFTGDIIGYLDTENPFDKHRETYGTLLIEENHLTVQRYHALKNAFSVHTFEAADPIIRALRNVKTADEIDTLRQAAKLADKCMEIGVAFLKEGVTEREVVNHIENEIKKYGVNEMSFDTMVLFGDHAAAPHGTPGDRQLKNNEYVLFDLGVIYNHYCSDITRTVAFGHPDDKAQAIYDIVLKAEQTAIQHIKPGVTISELDDIARGIITEAGYGEYFPHRLGHGLGLEAHEYQDISSTNQNPLEAGMVLTIEPGIYVPNVAGVRIEDDILVTEDGYESLSGYTK
ncbi:TPA: aminopeptidase P family protein [Staphylococcus pseudintermedius]|nr:aminopeptidase P family protein [Staphylococcus pseudintermedius]EIA5788448.1 aminopeptidase P family protein [Staphylococcus pseudintermedius]EJD8467717.1 aminopeptidase P family protein [Staphylococcus pseudintermedius]EJD8480884.1 aminopeptidase P family protein [Staphylococcus pseudintermedius]EJM2416583.1 aminopeptidase P family protein [Staphylococcus pseudintermedius]